MTRSPEEALAMVQQFRNQIVASGDIPATFASLATFALALATLSPSARGTSAGLAGGGRGLNPVNTHMPVFASSLYPVGTDPFQGGCPSSTLHHLHR